MPETTTTDMAMPASCCWTKAIHIIVPLYKRSDIGGGIFHHPRTSALWFPLFHHVLTTGTDPC